MLNLPFLFDKSFKLLFIFSIFLNSEVYAKPDLRPLGENIADQGSAYYQFQIQKFKSQDQKRTYKVWLGIPKNQKQNHLYPAVFMLDGNAVMDRIKEPLLKKLTEMDVSVLVAIGYDSDLPFETKSRALDYTPADETGKPNLDPRNPDRQSGGSQAFRQLIQDQIMPWVASKVTLDPHRKALWGHSYGGLFVLDSLLNDDQFSYYFAASPSLSWANNRILNQVAQADSKQIKGKNLLLMEGDLNLKNQTNSSPNSDPNMIENNRKLVAELNEKGVNSKFLIYPNLSHGQVFQASLLDILNNHFF